MKRYVHNICVFGILDLPAIHSRRELVANKFDIEYDPIMYKCMEERLMQNVLSQQNVSDLSVYKRFVSIPYK